MKLILNYVAFFLGIMYVLLMLLDFMGQGTVERLTWSFVLGFILFFSIAGLILTMKKDEVKK